MLERRARQLAAEVRRPPSPGPMPPVFERFTAAAHDAVEAGVAHARAVDDPYVEPAHLLFGLLDAEAGVVAKLRARHGWHLDPPAPVEHAVPRSHLDPPAPIAHEMAGSRRATGIFNPAARRIVAEEVLKIAHRFADRELSTGHLLFAILENQDENTAKLLDSLPYAQQLAAEVAEEMPGDEHG
jgi:ATP-dependent Clp protease ATP-binding subunit ClpA